MSKPSRLQRQVEQISKVASSGVSYARLACEKDILKLLKQERAAVRRKVQGMYGIGNKSRDPRLTQRAVGYMAACDELLDWLEHR